MKSTVKHLKDEKLKEDFEYDFCIYSKGFDFKTMTAEEAENHFDWFVNIIPGRIEYLKALYNSETGDTNRLDFSYESLISLWKWFLQKARIQKMNQEEYIALKEKYLQFGEDFISPWQLSVSTRYLVRDIGIYLSEVFRNSSENIQWHYNLKPNSYFFVNRPMLFGFIDNRFGKVFPCECDPLHLAEIQALKILDGESNNIDLYNIALKWKAFIV